MSRSIRSFLLIAIAPAALAAQSANQPGSDRAGLSADAFLNRPYTLLDRAVDLLNDDTQKLVRLWSDDKLMSDSVVVPKYGAVGDGSAWYDPRVGVINVLVSFGVSRVIGSKPNECEREVSRFADLLFGYGKDVHGNDMRVKNMIFRFGTARNADTSAAISAADALVRKTRLELLVIEQQSSLHFSCWTDAASRAVHAGAPPGMP